MGNICRSPCAEGVFRAWVERAGLAAEILVDSAGTIGYHAGAPPDARMAAAAARRGYRLDSVARPVSTGELDDWRLIVAMDRDNLARLEALAGGPRPQLRLLGSFLAGATGNADAAAVPDPYYGGPAGFEQVLDMIETACPALLAHCKLLLEFRGS